MSVTGQEKSSVLAENAFFNGFHFDIAFKISSIYNVLILLR